MNPDGCCQSRWILQKSNNGQPNSLWNISMYRKFGIMIGDSPVQIKLMIKDPFKIWSQDPQL